MRTLKILFFILPLFLPYLAYGEEKKQKQPAAVKPKQTASLIGPYVRSSKEQKSQLTNPSANKKADLMTIAHRLISEQKYQEASEYYKAYLIQHPNDKKISIHYIQTLLWAGDYSTAESQLKGYKGKFGEDEAYWTEEARLLALSGKYQAAIQQVDQIGKKFPENHELSIIKKYVEQRALQSPKVETSLPPKNPFKERTAHLVAAGQYQKAAEAYQAYLKDHQEDKEAWILYVKTLLWAGDYSTAESQLKAYKGKFGEDEAYWTEEARLLALSGKYQAAIQQVDQIGKKFPENHELSIIKKYAEQRALQSPKVETSSQPKNPFKEKAAHLVASGQYQKAAEAYQAYLKDHQEDKEAWILYVKTLLWAGDYSTAESQLKGYKGKFGEDEAYWTEEARLLALSGKYQAAIQQVDQIGKKFPENHELSIIKRYAEQRALQSPKVETSSQPKNLLKEKAAHLVASGQYQKAAEAYQAYLKDHQEDKDAWILYVKTLLWAGDYSTAESQLKGYKGKFGEDEAYWTEEARLLALSGKYQAAIQQVDQIGKKFPENHELSIIKKYAEQRTLQSPKVETSSPPKNPFKEKAAHLVAAGQYQKAAEAYQAYLKDHQEDKEAWVLYTKANLWAGNLRAAEKALQTYRKKFGSDRSYQIEKIRFLAFSGKFHEALQRLKQITKETKNHREAENLLEMKRYIENGLSSRQRLAKLKKAAPKNIQKSPSVRYYEASIKYAMINQPDQALMMIQKAVKLDPANIQYLKNQALYANWVNNQSLVYESYLKILSIQPNNPEAILGLARFYARKGAYGTAIQYYKAYITLKPENPDGLIEYAYTETWCSNFLAALNILHRYKRLFGVDFKYLKAKARILAEANYPIAALKINTPLLKAHPKDPGLLTAQSIALFRNRQPSEAFKVLDKLNELQKMDESLNNLNRFIRTPFRSNFGGDIYHSEDTDSVRINKLPFSEAFFLTPYTQFTIDGRLEHIQANLGSGLEPLQGGMGLDMFNIMAGLRQRINSKIALAVKAGVTRPTNLPDTTPSQVYNFLEIQGPSNAFIRTSIPDISAYNAAVILNPLDGVSMVISQNRDYYDVSARAVSLGVIRNFSHFGLAFTPFFLIQQGIFMEADYGSYSDTNREKKLLAAYKLGIIRRPRFSLDVGLFGLWDRFAKRLTHGYYDPLKYYYYAATIDASINFSQDIALLFSFGFGMQKDETFIREEPGGDASVKLLYGITKNVQITATVGTSTRGRSIGTNALTKRRYQVSAVDVGLVVRL